MEKIAEIQNRNIMFEEYDTSKNWITEFPKDNWCLIIIAEEENRNYFDEIIRKAIDRNVSYIFSVGKQHDLIHDMADEEIVFREVDFEDQILPKHLIFTAGVEDFENGIWQGIFISYQNEVNIEQVIILDVTKKAQNKVRNLIEKIELGYIPKN